MDWDRLFWKAYSDGCNIRHLTGHRLHDYAKAYADINERHHGRMGFDLFYLKFMRGVYECPTGGHWESVRHATHREKISNGTE